LNAWFHKWLKALIALRQEHHTILDFLIGLEAIVTSPPTPHPNQDQDTGPGTVAALKLKKPTLVSPKPMAAPLRPFDPSTLRPAQGSGLRVQGSGRGVRGQGSEICYIAQNLPQKPRVTASIRSVPTGDRKG